MKDFTLDFLIGDHRSETPMFFEEKLFIKTKTQDRLSQALQSLRQHSF